MRLGHIAERKFHKQLIGDLTFDLEGEQHRHRLFLHRNVMRVVAHHEKRQARVKANSTTPVNGTSNGVFQPPPETMPTASENSSVDASFLKRKSLRKSLEGLFRHEDAELMVDLKNIRRKLNFKSNLPEGDERPRKRVKRDVVQCQCHLAVWDNRAGFTSLEPVVKRSQLCSVITEDGPNGPVVNIEMEEPFRIKATELFVPVKAKGTLRMAIGDKYFLESKIIPTGSTEMWPPMPILSKSDTFTSGFGRNSIATVQGALVSSYANLPHAPPSGVPLSVSFVQDGRTFKTKYGLGVSASWTLPSIFEAKQENGEGDLLKKAALHSFDAYETPSTVQKDGDTANGVMKKLVLPKKTQLSYIWDVRGSRIIGKEFRTASLDGLCCAVCRTKEFESVKDLIFHLMTIHHKYKYKVEEEEKDPISGELVRLAIKVEFADVVRQKASNHVKDEREMDWVTPKRPFDINAYVNGDHTWVGVQPRRRNQAHNLAPKDDSAVISASPRRKAGFLSPDEVLDIPSPKRKRFKVVTSRTMEQTAFFRSVSHRPVRVDESPLSESDDDIDNSWIRDKHRDRIIEHDDLTAAEKEFLTRWDLHILIEKSPSGRYISDSLIRFVRNNKFWLRQSHIFQEFHKLIHELKEHALIDDRVIAGCFKIVWREENTESDTVVVGKVEQGVLERFAEPGNSEFAQSTPKQSNGYLTTDDTHLSDSSGCGICLRAVTRKKLAIACSDPVRRPDPQARRPLTET